MAYFTAHDLPPAQLDHDTVTSSDVYVLLAGFRYGSPVRDRPEVSYTEHEFEVAGEAGLPRLVILLSEQAQGPAGLFVDPQYGARQAGSRRRPAGQRDHHNAGDLARQHRGRGAGRAAPVAARRFGARASRAGVGDPGPPCPVHRPGHRANGPAGGIDRKQAGRGASGTRYGRDRENHQRPWNTPTATPTSTTSPGGSPPNNPT
jgi:hypothetical protein